jgi:hypothetical protein
MLFSARGGRARSEHGGLQDASNLPARDAAVYHGLVNIHVLRVDEGALVCGWEESAGLFVCGHGGCDIGQDCRLCIGCETGKSVMGR